VEAPRPARRAEPPQAPQQEQPEPERLEPEQRSAQAFVPQQALQQR
jgi:hypothetical protein